MQSLNPLDLILRPFVIPFSALHPFLPLGFLCFFISLIGLSVYKKVTDQKKLQFINENIKLIHLEMRIRPNDLPELLRLLAKSIGWNLIYLKNSILPSLVIIIPLCFLLLPIESYFSHYPIRVGNIFSVEITQNQANENQSIELSETPLGLELIETEAIAGPKLLKGWYFRAKKKWFLLFEV